MWQGFVFVMVSLAGFLVIYHHFIYPILLKILASVVKLFSKKPIQQTLTSVPSITLVMPIHNEAEFIARKLRNLAIQLYPSDKLLVHLIFDGCTDRSLELAKETLASEQCAELDVKISTFASNRGKIEAISFPLAIHHTRPRLCHSTHTVLQQSLEGCDMPKNKILNQINPSQQFTIRQNSTNNRYSIHEHLCEKQN